LDFFLHAADRRGDIPGDNHARQRLLNRMQEHSMAKLGFAEAINAD